MQDPCNKESERVQRRRRRRRSEGGRGWTGTDWIANRGENQADVGTVSGFSGSRHLRSSSEARTLGWSCRLHPPWLTFITCSPLFSTMRNLHNFSRPTVRSSTLVGIRQSTQTLSLNSPSTSLDYRKVSIDLQGSSALYVLLWRATSVQLLLTL